MKRFGKRTVLASMVSLTVLLGSLGSRAWADPMPKDGDRMAVCGDSITEQKNYSVDIEDYLLMCQPADKIQTAQFGWSGETTWGFAPRMERDVLWFKPTVASVVYGMNDGGYTSVDAKRLAMYKEKTADMIKQFKAAGTRVVIVTGPGAVDSDAYHHPGSTSEQYNQTLAAFAAAAKQVAEENGATYADMHGNMVKAMEQFKKLHPGKSFVGGDGVHPENVGHMVMAYTILKGMGCDGNIGTITVDLSKNSAEATAGHKVLSMADGKAEIESSKYPFCPANPAADATGQRAALSVIPFNLELNRFMLIAKNGTAKKYHVSYGPITKDFDADQLAAGINLTVEFDKSPFDAAWTKVDAVVRAQQDFETPLTKQWLHNEPVWAAQLPQAADGFKQIADQGKAADDAWRTTASEAVTPVKWTLTIAPA